MHSFAARAQTSTTTNRTSVADDNSCGQICSVKFSSKQAGRYYPLLRKHVNCSAMMRRMANPPAVRITPPPRIPPPDTYMSFTQNGQCPLKAKWYIDQSNSSSSSRPLYFDASKFRKLMEADRSGKIISHYADPYRLLKRTLFRYRNYIKNAHVAVVGTAMPWAEAILMNLGAGRITVLEYRALVIEHKRVFTVTPSRFANNFLTATNNGAAVRCICDCFALMLSLM